MPGPVCGPHLCPTQPSEPSGPSVN
jgi:hypothetical protein